MGILREDLDAGRVDLSDVIDGSAVAIDPVAPGVRLREEWLEPLGITAYKLAADIGVPSNRITMIVAGQRAITADTALRLARYFETDPQSWLNLQTRYDLALETKRHGEEIERIVRPRLAG